MEKSISKPQINAVAIIKRSAQISPDDWDTWNEALQINEDTTIGEIVQWMQTKQPSKKPFFTDFTVSPLYTTGDHIK